MLTVQSFSSVWSLQPHILQHARFPVIHHLPELAQTHVHWVSDAIQPSCPLSSPSHPAFNLSQHWVFSNELALHIRWPQYWSFSFSISPSNEYSGLISFRIDWLDLLADQGTLKSLLQHHSSKASILRCSVFFMVQLSHLYMTTGKTIALTIWTFVGKVMSLIFNMLLRFVIAFHQRSKHLLIFSFKCLLKLLLEGHEHWLKTWLSSGRPCLKFCHFPFWGSVFLFSHLWKWDEPTYFPISLQGLNTLMYASV